MNGSAPRLYEVRVEGLLDGDWGPWFDGFEVTAEGSQSVLSGTVQDQAALHGVLLKIRDLGLQLISVRCADADLAPPGEAGHD